MRVAGQLQICLPAWDRHPIPGWDDAQPAARLQTSLEQTHSTPLLPPAIHPQPITSNFPVLGGVRRGSGREGGKAVVSLKQTHMVLFTNRRLFGFVMVTRRWHWLDGYFKSETERGGRGESCGLWWSAGRAELWAEEMVHLCIKYKRPTNTRLFHPSTPPPHPIHIGSPQHLRLLFGFPKSAFPKLQTRSEEVPDSPELECLPFPQETWSVSSQGALDRRVHTHTHTQIRQHRATTTGQSDEQNRMKSQDEKACWMWLKNKKMYLQEWEPVLMFYIVAQWELFFFTVKFLKFCFKDIILQNIIIKVIWIIW